MSSISINSADARTAEPSATGFRSNQWVQLVAGIICMAMIANLQYGWTIFVSPIDAKYHWGKVAIQVSFTLFILFETWLVPFEGYLADRFGPRPLVMVGGVLVAAAWIVNARASALSTLYLGGAIGGMGAGLVYGTCIGNAVKWFEQRRGLAAGLTAAGFGAGAAITILPLTHSLATRGYEATFFNFALIQGGIVFLAALALAKPSKGAAARRTNPSGSCNPPKARFQDECRSARICMACTRTLRSSARAAECSKSSSKTFRRSKTQSPWIR